MIFILDNGEAFSNHTLLFVDAPEDFDRCSMTSIVLGSTAPSIAADDRGHAPSVERRERGSYNLRPVKEGYEVSIDEEPMHEFSTMRSSIFLAEIVVQERDGEPRPRYRLEVET